MWCLITWTTYGYWLPGDPRGFRTRRHKQHVPPPKRYAGNEESYDPQVFKGLFESAKRKSGIFIELSSEQAGMVFGILSEAIQPHIERPAIVSIGRHHVHILVDPVGCDVPALCMLAKGRSATKLRKSGLKKMKWARGYHTRFFNSDEQARNAWRYISRHKQRGAIVRRINPVQSK